MFKQLRPEDTRPDPSMWLSRTWLFPTLIGLLQFVKRAARGFRTPTNFIAIADLHISKLRHLPAHPFAPAIS